jgi:hypothetical protein
MGCRDDQIPVGVAPDDACGLPVPDVVEAALELRGGGV